MGHDLSQDAEIWDDAYKLDRAHVFHSWHAQRNLDPTEVVTGHGVWLKYGDGREMLDFTSQQVNVNIGYQHPKVIEGIKKQAELLCTVGPDYANLARGRAASLVARRAPEGFDKVFFLHGHETDHQYYAQDELGGGLKAEDYYEDHVMEKADEILGENVMRPLMNQVECHLKERQYWKSDGDQHAAQIMKEAVRNLERVDRNKSFFMWIDCFDPHEPWDAPSVYDPDLKCPYDPDYEGKDMFLPIQGHVDGLYTDRELEHIRALYAEKVTMVDKWFGHLMNNIRTLGMEDDTLVILVSDHGSPMGKGEHGHGIMRKCRPWPYEELAHIPMIMRGPGLPRNRRVRGFVQSCDVAPTVVDWLGIGVHPSMQDHSLLPLAKGDVEKVREFAIAGYFRYSWSIITEDWSFIHWLKDDEKSVADARFGIYGKDLGESTAHILQMKKANAVEDRDTAFYNRAYEEHKKAATLDGEDQWTCTAAASSEVPARDELYCRKDDPFQLNNVSAKHPEVAKELFEQLKLFMAELRAS